MLREVGEYVLLHDLERVSDDAQFVQHLVELFAEDSLHLLVKIEEALMHHHHAEFKSHVHALKGSALNLGAKRLFTHCTKIESLTYSDLESNAAALSTETRALTLETQAALDQYVKNRGVATL